ncbi:hypothetical protein [Corynebacterium riegelii]|uniref:hypothetical protein n=1 Tax=Corynebacterium riegelii TaxID=156976 RepID=UPI00191FB87F|nr:hypothetical protein [Corynebacterium riegelii]QQU84060.1 hypothetical protein I6I71_00110 [Corynebacterium riegelii]
MPDPLNTQHPQHPQDTQNALPETPASTEKRTTKRRFPKSRVTQVMWFLIAMCVVAAAISAL